MIRNTPPCSLHDFEDNTLLCHSCWDMVLGWDMTCHLTLRLQIWEFALDLRCYYIAITLQSNQYENSANRRVCLLTLSRGYWGDYQCSTVLGQDSNNTWSLHISHLKSDDIIVLWLSSVYNHIITCAKSPSEDRYFCFFSVQLSE